jgi:hypothetical protein
MFDSMNFQKWTIVIFTIIFVIILIYLGMNINKPDTSILWPPITANCPDYWADVNGDGTSCVGTKDSNTGSWSSFNGLTPITTASDPIAPFVSTVPNFTTGSYIGSNSLCSKYTWATTNGVAWDGITYGVTNPCN